MYFRPEFFLVLFIPLVLLELLIPSHGLIVVSGLLAFCGASFLLWGPPSCWPALQISVPAILSAIISLSLFLLFVIQRVIAAKRQKPKTGLESFVGMEAVVETDLNPVGYVHVNGELWMAEAGEIIPAGQRVTIERVSDVKLFVKKK